MWEAGIPSGIEYPLLFGTECIQESFAFYALLLSVIGSDAVADSV